MNDGKRSASPGALGRVDRIEYEAPDSANVQQPGRGFLWNVLDQIAIRDLGHGGPGKVILSEADGN